MNETIGKWARRGQRRVRRWRVSRDVDGRSFKGTSEAALAQGADSSDLGRIFFDHDGRLVDKWTHYLPAYDEQFAPYREGFPLADGTTRPVRILEMGISQGGSLQMWRRYFGPEAVIWGIDINPEVLGIDDPDLEVRVGSQADPDFLRGIVEEMGGVDIVLDDGSHVASHQRESLRVLFPLLEDGGLYVVEDLHTSYWYEFEGGYRRSGAFLEVVKDLIDDMHAWYHKKPARSPIDAVGNVPRITIYDSVVFLRKASRTRPMYVRRGEPLSGGS